MALQESGEMYLETIYILLKENPTVRAIDVGEYMGFSKPSVSIFMKNLRENGYIEMDRDGLITLTDRGMAIAAKMLDRHHTLTQFLVALGVDQETAEADACKIEHDISSQTFAAICRHAKEHQG